MIKDMLPKQRHPLHLQLIHPRLLCVMLVQVHKALLHPFQEYREVLIPVETKVLDQLSSLKIPYPGLQIRQEVPGQDLRELCIELLLESLLGHDGQIIDDSEVSGAYLWNLEYSWFENTCFRPKLRTMMASSSPWACRWVRSLEIPCSSTYFHYA